MSAADVTEPAGGGEIAASADAPAHKKVSTVAELPHPTIEIPLTVSRPMSRAAIAITSSLPTPVLTARSHMSIELPPEKPFWAPMAGLPERTSEPLQLALQLVGVERWEDSPWMRVVEAWEMRKHANEVFDMIDKNKSGILEKREMTSALHKEPSVTAKLHESPHEPVRSMSNPKRATNIFTKMDTNNDALVDRSEFTQYIFLLCDVDEYSKQKLTEFGDADKLPPEQWEGEASGVMRNGVAFAAHFVNGRMHGQGQLVWPDGQRYSGELAHNVAQGKGALQFVDGSRYTGQVSVGLRDGEGLFEGCDGSTYQGQWKEGKRDGQGKLVYADGGEYEGGWSRGCKCGSGKFKYSSGSEYDGEWLEDQMHGHGTMTWKERQERYVGQWCESQPHGKGEHTWLETAQRDGMVNNKYDGQFDCGSRHGKGAFYYCDNTVYDGEWSHNEKHGAGVWREPNGDEMKTIFVHNRILDGETGEYVASVAQMQGRAIDTKDLPLAEAEDSLNVGAMFNALGKNAPDKAAIQRVQDLMTRHKVELTEIYRYYAGLGESVGEAMYTLSCHQFCQLCKDCEIPNKMFPLAFCDALFTEVCQQVKSSVLPLKQFFSLLVRVGMKRYPELSDSVYKQLHALLEERILPHAKSQGADTFRQVLYQPTTQALIMKMRPKLAIIFDHYAAQDLDSTPDAWMKSNTLNMREYLMMLREMHFLTSLDDLNKNEKLKDKARSVGITKTQRDEANEFKKMKLLRSAEGITLYKAEFGAKEAFASFSASNIDSDWETTSHFTLDTEMVMMEFVEGVARLALMRLERKSKPIEEFEHEFEVFISDMVKRFPHWTKYSDSAAVSPRFNQ